ncbi:MFS transporter [Rhodothermus profundi]|uniref:Major Facilitator Superfamily protein n=1 Tax=Rhodothermus profundi TaxID=633813 RepID=A0A1M6Q5E5_9BACT|nr:MFS transporter [Rhodothermus profundi]SHK15442.1 Major Facilitator Superfamily protein [Rhodothermus profundi]
MGRAASPTTRQALWLIVLFGLVSLLADLTYESARSLIGPYLGWLGASATAVGVVAGAGELVGYGLRLISGYLSDRTRRYWTLTLLGYAVNLLAVPALALAGRWEIAAALIIAERAGKALRAPARDVLLSHATAQVGHGRGFGLHEALDQIGAVAGPLLMAGVLWQGRSYQTAFALLLVPALLALLLLGVARLRYPRPQTLERTEAARPTHRALPRTFWIYLLGTGLLAAGYADFPLIAFHFREARVLPEAWIPLSYALAMGVDAVAALLLGRLFDRRGPVILALAVALTAAFAPLVFWGGALAAWVGMAIWGVGMGAQESILRAALAQMIPAERRGTAFGLFHAIFGVCWFGGSALLGVLYDTSISVLVSVAVGLQVLAALVLGWMSRQPKR